MANISTEERKRREAEAERAKQSEEAFNVNTDNLREPVEAVREGAKPITKAAGALAVGTPGTYEPPDPEEARVEVEEATTRVPMFGVKFKHGYFAKAGGEKIAAGTEMELPIEEARYLIEAGIAEVSAKLPPNV